LTFDISFLRVLVKLLLYILEIIPTYNRQDMNTFSLA
jgi:hypothetical protein